MRRILGFPVALCVSGLALSFASGCGQSEGERCRINSDCSSGLFCDQGSTGNGTCKSNNGPTTDAAEKQDVPVASGPEVEPTDDAEGAALPDVFEPVDATAVDTGAIDTM